MKRILPYCFTKQNLTNIFYKDIWRDLSPVLVKFNNQTIEYKYYGFELTQYSRKVFYTYNDKKIEASKIIDELLKNEIKSIKEIDYYNYNYKFTRLEICLI